MHHGDIRAAVFAAYYETVMGIARTHGWSIACEYDIQQREALAFNPAHDISTLDTTALTLIATRRALPSPSKRGPSTFDDDNEFENPSRAKRARNSCFRCGSADHLPNTCQASVTLAGIGVAPLTGDPQRPNALRAPNGKQYCFNWMQKSTCSFGKECSHFHGCSLCGVTSHGAGSCKYLA